MLINVLISKGAMIDDIEDWDAKVQGNTLVVSGPISPGGIRRSLSVLDLPASLATAMDSVTSETSPGDSGSIARPASQQYYKSVESLLKDLRQEKRDKKTYTAGSVALWYDKYGRKMDNLPILNVDDDLLAYGRDVAELLRGGETALKSVGMRTGLRTGEVEGNTGYNSVYGYESNYGGYGGYRSGYAVGYTNPYSASREQSRAEMNIRTQEQVRGAVSLTETDPFASTSRMDAFALEFFGELGYNNGFQNRKTLTMKWIHVFSDRIGAAERTFGIAAAAA